MQADHARNDTPATWRRWLPRFSLRQLLLATTFVAIGCYALRWASPWWSSVLFYLCAILILGGGLLSINWSGEARSFWLGFVLFASGHLLVTSAQLQFLFPHDSFTVELSRRAYQALAPSLTVQPIRVTPEELDGFEGRGGGVVVESLPKSDGLPMIPPRFQSGVDGKFRATAGPGEFRVHEYDFVNVALGLWTLLLGYVGGQISVILYRCRSPADAARNQ